MFWEIQFLFRNGEEEMKKSKLLTAILVAATAIVLAGCKKTSTEPVSIVDYIVDSEIAQGVTSEAPVIVDNSEIVPVEPDQTSGVLASITVNFVYSEGTADTIEMLNIGGVASQPDETGHIMYGYDEAETLIYQREDTSFTDEDGKLNVTISYDFYNLDYNFDLAFDPMDPENGGDIQSINGSILKNVNGTETVEDYTWENVGIRGETGIWYAGVCSCRNGVIGAYEVQ